MPGSAGRLLVWLGASPGSGTRCRGAACALLTRSGSNAVTLTGGTATDERLISAELSGSSGFQRGPGRGSSRADSPVKALATPVSVLLRL